MRNIIANLISFLKNTLKGKMVVSVNLLLIRKIITKKSTIGELFLNGKFQAHTLELPWKDNERSISCIPEGKYNVRMRYPRESGSRDYLHLLVKDVPNRDYILFHKGNSAKDSRGCILTGQSASKDFIANSSIAHKNLLDSLIDLGETNNINLIIKNR